MTEQQKFTAEALWIAGHTVAAIAKALGVSRGAVSGHITRSSLPTGPT
ncbi:helix-turn-helix domain-containing protein [Rhizobium deserti]|nr:helix-turn-helix domain-containing protein [Rhizobium deserti]